MSRAADDNPAPFEAVAQSAARIRAFLPPGPRRRLRWSSARAWAATPTQLAARHGIDYAEIGFPRSGVVGHAGRLVYGREQAEQRVTPASKCC
jgi:hypothetical protein